MKEFDHPGFHIPNKEGLQLVVVAVRKALHGNFPVEELLKPWTNSEGQVSYYGTKWVMQAVTADVNFLFASPERE